jgi:hypothetical protein
MGKPCRNRAVSDRLCAVHSGELSRKGVEARRNRKSSDGGKAKLRKAIQRAFEAKPDVVAERLLTTTSGVERAWELAYQESASAPREGSSGGTTIVLVETCFRGIRRDGIYTVRDDDLGETRVLTVAEWDSLPLLEDYAKEHGS